MTSMDDQDLRSLFAQEAGPEENGFTAAVMKRVEHQRQLLRWSNRLVVVGVLAVAALLAPWVALWAGEGFRFLAQALSQAPQVPQLPLISLAALGLLGLGTITWSFRN